MNPKVKVLIPNILTVTRLVFSPIIIILGITKLYKVAVILAIIAAITDFFDGKLARKWNTVTDLGAKLDSISDKVFSISLLVFLLFKNVVFVPILFLEIVIASFNFYSYKKTNIYEVLMIGKIKTTILFTTMIFTFISLFTNIQTLIYGLGAMTINIQILTLISYIINSYDNIKNEELEEAISNDKTTTRTKIFDIEKQENKIIKEEFDSDTKVLNTIKDIFK